VTDGKLNVTYGGDPAGLFTSSFVSSYSGTMPVVVGFTYTSDGQLLRPATPQESGARIGPAIGKKRRLQYITAMLVNTRGISFGTSFSKLNAARLASAGGTPIAATAMFSGVFRDSLTDDYSYDGMICWRVTRPYPATIAALGGFIQTQDA
jgi:hypothetical protein